MGTGFRLHREVAALAQAEDERAVSAFGCSGCTGRWPPCAGPRTSGALLPLLLLLLYRLCVATA